MEIVQFIAGIVVVATAIVGGLWAVFKFLRLRSVRKALNVTTHSRVHYSQENAVVEITVELTNTGSVPIYGQLPDNQKSTLQVKVLPSCTETGDIDFDDPTLENLIEPIAYLRYYDRYEPGSERQHRIVLEPNTPCELKGHVSFCTDHMGLLLVRCSFFDEDEVMWLHHEIVDTREPKS